MWQGGGQKRSIYHTTGVAHGSTGEHQELSVLDTYSSTKLGVFVAQAKVTKYTTVTCRSDAVLSGVVL